MAKIKQGILGGFSGKVASLVGTSWKGRAVMKSLPLSVANPRTESQVGQRNKFSKVAELASQILTQFVQPVENPISGNISGYNLFCKDNKTAFDAVGDLVPANLCAGGGKIINLETPSVFVDTVNSELDLSWMNSVDLSALRKTDNVFAFALREDDLALFLLKAAATRNDENAVLAPVDRSTTISVGDKFAVVYACVSADGRDVSVKTFAREQTAA